jgi:hypothetical protein
VKITIESTDVLTRVNGQECRVWKGTGRTAALRSRPSFPRSRSTRGMDVSQFERELIETAPPQELCTRAAQELAVVMGEL